MNHRDMGKATFGQLGNRDIPRSKCSTRVCTFMHLGVKGLKQRCNTPTGEIGSYISREKIL